MSLKRQALCFSKQMSSQAAVVLAAGKGTRMNSRVPKVLHRVCGVPMVKLVVKTVQAAGLDPTVVVVSSDSSDVKDALGDDVEYAEQPRQLGTRDALLHAREKLRGAGDFILTHGDVPLIRPETVSSLLHLHQSTDAVVTILTADLDEPGDLGRIVRDEKGRVSEIVEDSVADESTKAITEINTGTYCFSAAWLWPNLEALEPSSTGEVFLTDLIKWAHDQEMVVESEMVGEPAEALGVNTRVHLAAAQALLQDRIRRNWMLSGVTMIDPGSVYIEAEVQIGRDTVVYPNSHVIGVSTVGEECCVGPNSIVDSSTLGDGCEVVSSVVRESTLEARVHVGPFAHVRGGSHLERDVYIGSHAEVKASRLGRSTKSSHFSYLGDADVGANVNIGAGTVTVNYDGADHHSTRIEDDVSIGSDSMLVAPVTIGAGSSTGAGAVITRDVPAGSLAKGVPARSEPKRSAPKRRTRAAS